MNMKMALFLDVAAYILVEIFGCFTEPCCFYRQGRVSVYDHKLALMFYTDLLKRQYLFTRRHGVTPKKTAVFAIPSDPTV
jgi:hypothetical protein